MAMLYRACDIIPAHESFDSLRKSFIDFFEHTLSSKTNEGGVQYKLADVNFATSCYQYLQTACQRGALSEIIDRDIVRFCALLHLGQFTGSSVQDILLLNRLKYNLYKISVANEKCERLQYRASADIKRAYITFETEEAFHACLTNFGPDVDPVDVVPFYDNRPISVHKVYNVTCMLLSLFYMSAMPY
jgi:hypothetical protein